MEAYTGSSHVIKHEHNNYQRISTMCLCVVYVVTQAVAACVCANLNTMTFVLIAEYGKLVNGGTSNLFDLRLVFGHCLLQHH